jgi:hypothetical protein
MTLTHPGMDIHRSIFFSSVEKRVMPGIRGQKAFGRPDVGARRWATAAQRTKRHGGLCWCSIRKRRSVLVGR